MILSPKVTKIYTESLIQVPLNWLEPTDDDRVVLAVIRAPAKNRKDYRGPVFVNPGVSYLVHDMFSKTNLYTFRALAGLESPGSLILPKALPTTCRRLSEITM